MNKITQLIRCGCFTLAGFGLSLGASAVVFQAENYNAFYDTTPGNTGGVYRGDDVDIEATSDTGGGYNVGWIEANEWLAYNNLTIPSSGSYTVRMRVASPNGATASVDLNAGGIVLGDFPIPATGGWQNWTTVTRNVNINAGTYNLGVFARTNGWNFNWIEIVPNGASAKVTVFQHCNYGGWSVGLDVGSYNLAALQSRGFIDNDASSLRVAAGYEAVLYQGNNFTGTSRVVTADDDCLVNEGFNDNVTSVIVRAASSNRPLVWADEFNNINTANWTFETGGGGWGNNELQYYTGGQNASIQYDAQAGSNVLVLEARRDNPGNYQCWYGRCNYTSTRMITRDKKTFQYGRIEARLKLPQTQGIWPAFWMLGNDLGQVGWPNSGEIDIMEHVGFEPTITHGAIHGPSYSGNTPFMGTYQMGQYVDADYHVYAVEWNTNEIVWYVDNNRFYSVSRSQVQNYGNWAFDKPFFLLLNVAVGGNWPGSPDAGSVFPQRMYVDYVRVYQ
ncbi:family 16 glycosylhydrolase [Cellvibrio japonicus]|uniref:Beta glucanase, putative, glu16F n=1 Tax=Cellvibrio japonicus (strain Ueda107) TaxID=498211 RepID=B3PBJ2_CELJU|nr:family 16 glycosylhydrolase [Cellvibrio japonicus]ACE84459.1 beta glucanase, putative, glu16F [Cellvibrio japonicus Ueda107]QEI13106.1 family 16 glycosylhydrolase [Cellvibrio japonicus]QEI16680.1 family 16 glycosylhydrolase [Cellvibrio japonicus]QEI20258.1 family 16 glycosylhydrolase [Cellvibrio japonicus]